MNVPPRHRLYRTRWRWSLPAMWLLALSNTAHAALPEYEVKAAIIYKITRFVTWPAQQDATRPFNLCVLGTDPFESALDGLTGKSVRNQKITIQRLSDAAPAALQCDLAFISSSTSKKLPEVLTALKGRAILTISDVPEFAHHGGMLGLVKRDNKIVFEINIAAARAAGIDISSQLLQLATIVDGRNEKP